MVFGTAVVVFAHPDDAEFMCGGTIARWARKGTEVHYVCCTDGSAGSNVPGDRREDIARWREAELREAAAVLGVASVTILGFEDGFLEVTPDLRRAVTREVRRRRPDVLVAQDPSRLYARGEYVNHPDHRAAGEVALRAVNPDSPSRPQFPELLDEGFEPFEVPALWLAAEEADTHVDVTDTIEVKVEALLRHTSQMGHMEVDRIVRERGRDAAAAAGDGFAGEFAEGYRTFVFSPGSGAALQKAAELEAAAREEAG
jgi:LmbE family N-acetylglucosaminyl deacetylase